MPRALRIAPLASLYLGFVLMLVGCGELGPGNPHGNAKHETLIGASSNHSGGVNVASLDGSVRSVKDTVNLASWASLATMGGGEVFGADSFSLRRDHPHHDYVRRASNEIDRLESPAKSPYSPALFRPPRTSWTGQAAPRTRRDGRRGRRHPRLHRDDQGL